MKKNIALLSILVALTSTAVLSSISKETICRSIKMSNDDLSSVKKLDLPKEDLHRNSLCDVHNNKPNKEE